jgi:predicted DNA-binding transcriptional regulator YafY
VTAQEVADRFSISLRTVYRDVKAIEESGVPVIGEAGSGYTIMEGYRLPPVMFTQEEAAALLLGGMMAEQRTDASVKKHIGAAMFKIKAVLRSGDKDHVDQLEDHVAIIQPRNNIDESSGQHLAALQKTIVDKRVIFIRYLSNNEEITERQVEPIGLWYYGDSWHLIGWCRLRSGYRDFRVSRIQRLQVRDEGFTNSPHPSLQDYIKSMVCTSDLKEVVVKFKKEVAKYINVQRYTYGYVKEEPDGDYIRMQFVTSSLDYVARWLLMYTSAVTIESPAELSAAMRNLISEINSHYA